MTQTHPWPESCSWRPLLLAELPALASENAHAFEQVLSLYPKQCRSVLEQLRPALWCSPWALEMLQRYPEQGAELLAQSQLGKTDCVVALEELSLDMMEPAFMAALRQLRQREMVRIALRDLMGWASLEETLADLSALASQCIARADEYARQALMPRFGVPRNGEGIEQRLIILGMGKLGGGELNFSSDIDLIFIYPEAGETDGRKVLDNQAYFIRHGQLLIRLLDELTADGFVFRVDMRLRPFGDAGPLAVSFAAMENYYQTQGREWERYAMVKAKALTGAPEDIATFQALLKPFVFRRYLDFSAIQSLRELKRMIEEQVQRKGMQHNIKLGRGGIREVEFIGQAFQLIYGGKNQALQQRGIVPVLQQLHADRLLEADVVSDLLRAYTFLRLAENRLQMVADAQTHDLPEDAGGQQRLAYAMGFADWGAFTEVLGGHREVVAQQFADVFAESAEPVSSNQWQDYWCALGSAQGSAGNELNADVFASLNLQQVDEHVRRLLALRQSSLYSKASREAQRRVDDFVPVLFEALLSVKGDRDAALSRALDFMRAVMRRSVYLVLLQENPNTLKRLLSFFAQSEWIAEQLIQQPAMLDQLIDTRLLYALKERPELDEELRESLDGVSAGDYEGWLDTMRSFKRSYTLGVAAVDVTDHMPLMRVSDHLTQCAEVMVQEAHRLAWVELVNKHGFPHCWRDGEVHNPGMAVIAYGKLGGIELGYSSDLDVVFLHDSSGQKEYTSGREDGKGDIDNTLFFARMAQKFSSIMSAQTRNGILYEVDTRLRPNGDSGEWVKGIAGFARYQREEAWTWEHQALVRARCICGSAALKEQFEAIRIEILTRPRNRQELLAEVVEMREKMRANLGGTNGMFSLKQDSGGLTDIEFMVQYAVLAWASEHEVLTRWTDNIRILEVMAQVGVITQKDSDILIESYRAIRAKIHRLALDKRKSQVEELGKLAPVVNAVADVWQRFMTLA